MKLKEFIEALQELQKKHGDGVDVYSYEEGDYYPSNGPRYSTHPIYEDQGYKDIPVIKV